MMGLRSHIDADDLADFAAKLIAGADADEEQATITAGALVWCDRVGRSLQGVWRLPILLDRLDRGVVRCPCAPVWSQVAPSIAIVDGDRGFGQYLGHVAMEKAIALARGAGIAAVGVRNSNHFGAGGYFVDRAAAANMVGIAMSNSVPKVAPPGATRRALGTNPIAFAAPRKNGRPVIVDLATSASAGSEVRHAIDEGRDLPEGVAIDREGRPVTDPTQAAAGALLPLGGARGYGLGVMVEILAGVLTGAAVAHQIGSFFHDFDRPANLGHLFVAIDIEPFAARDGFADRMEQLATSLVGGGDSVRLPGDARWRCLDATARDGVVVDDATRRALEQRAAARSITPPWTR